MSWFLDSSVGPATLYSSFQALLPSGFWGIWLARLIVSALILLAARMLVRAFRRLLAHGVSAAVARTGRGQRRLNTLQGLLSSTFSYAIYFVACLLALFALGVPPGTLAPLLGFASVLGLAVGFGAQRLVRDVITGLFILGEGQFDVGDWVTIGSVTGRVEDIGLRITRLRDDQGRAYIIANGDVTHVFNASDGAIRLPIELTLQRTTPLDEGLALLRATAEETLRTFTVTATSPEMEPAVMVIGMDAAKVSVRLVLWVPVGDRDAIEDALRRRLLLVIAEKPNEFALA
ncbi:MAG TPA: mechanosensitive ion channel domain-containing protein [Armatimonadota bacterium]